MCQSSDVCARLCHAQSDIECICVRACVCYTRSQFGESAFLMEVEKVLVTDVPEYWCVCVCACVMPKVILCVYVCVCVRVCVLDKEPFGDSAFLLEVLVPE